MTIAVKIIYWKILVLSVMSSVSGLMKISRLIVNIS